MQKQQNAQLAVIFAAIIALTIAIDLRANVTWQEVVALVALIALHGWLSLLGHPPSMDSAAIEKRLLEQIALIAKELEEQKNRLRACEVTRGIHRN